MKNTKKGQVKKCTNREYHVQHNKDVKHQDVKMYCAENQFPELKFLGPHKKPHDVHGLGKHYHMCFNIKLGHCTYTIFFINCACTQCTYSLDQTYISGLPAQKQTRYQPIKYFTYRPVLGSFNNWIIIKLSHKATSSEEIDKIHQFVLDGISEKMDALVQTGQYGAINATDTATIGHYVIRFMSEPYTLQ